MNTTPQRIIASIALLSLALACPSHADWRKYTLANDTINIKLGARLHGDAALLRYAPEEFENDQIVRRSRLSLSIKLFDRIKFNAQYDPVDDDSPYSLLSLAYQHHNSEFKIGQYVEPFGLDNSTSSNELLFMERALPTALMPGTSVGLGFRHWSNRASISAGMFWETYIEDNTLIDANEDRGLSMRMTLRPYQIKRGFTHLGVSVSARLPDDRYRLRYRARPESYAIDEKLISTGRMKNVEYHLHTGLEAAIVAGPWSLQGEWTQAQVFFQDVDQEQDSLKGGYWTLAYSITGESRRYSKRSGVIRAIKARRASAWEIALRQSWLDFNTLSQQGGRMDNITLGLNWYMNHYIRWMTNYIRVEVNDDEQAPMTFDIVQLRLQLAF